MRRNRLGCLSVYGLVAALITALFIAGSAFTSGGLMFSPGALNAIRGQVLGGVSSHADIAGQCGLCHTAPWEFATMDDRCMACHTNIPAELTDLRTAHGRMEAIDPVAACRDCHPEHNGPAAPLTDIEGWRYPHDLSGYALKAHQFKGEDDPFMCSDCHGSDVTTFDVNTCAACHGRMDPAFVSAHSAAYGSSCLECHDGIDSLGSHFTHDAFPFKLTGKHATVTCDRCHSNARSLTDFTGLAQDCFSCHGSRDPHGGSLGTDCASCHTTDGWKPAKFDHSRTRFPLTGAHTAATCSDCHTDLSFKGASLDCFGCHAQDDRHLGQLGTDCGLCHRSTTWREVSFDHSKTGFLLTGQHVNGTCASCHTNNVFKGTPTACASCHVDAHAGQFGNQCDRCHSTSAWKPAHFDHSKSGFPLIGSHVLVDCEACHINNVFKGTPKDCLSCHASKDVHNGQFGRDCASCHKPTKWQEVSFDHGRTSFRLSDSHTSVACRSCHVNNVFQGTPSDCFSCHASRDAHNGQFGSDCSSCHKPTRWRDVFFDHSSTAYPLTGLHTNVACTSCHVNGVYRGTPRDCYSCHASRDRHQGQFGTVCSACHVTSSWANVSFDHRSTGFPLAGSHASVACASCHINGRYAGTPTNCLACHAARDQHNGQFGTDCGSCHQPSRWSDVSFNHNNTAFPLTGRHTSVLCAACHANGMYRGTPTNCFACHATRDAHNGQFGTNCGTCHTTSGWGNATFDHNNTGFPLIGKHANLSCVQCHANGVYQGTPSQCIACHADKDEHNGRNGTDCGMCHTPNDWGDVNVP